MTSMNSKLISQHLPPCVFCGDIHPQVISGPCAFTTPENFQAQVACGHCGATGTRYCGEEDLTEAEIKAAQDWARAAKPEPTLRKSLSSFNTWFFTLMMGAMIGGLILPDEAPASFFGIMIGASFILGVVLGVLEGRETYKRQISQWEALKDKLMSQGS